MSLELQPITLVEAQEFTEQHHRHNRPPQGHKFSIAVNDGEKIVGVVCVGRPVARHSDTGWTLELTRCCTDGTKNAASKLYGAAWRATRALGYKKLITYTLAEEPGVSLVASGYPRTKRPTSSLFQSTFARARDLVLSSNLTLRRDGLPYANQPEPPDRGAAVYFTLRGAERVLACDRWLTVTDNIQALRKTVEAMRGMDRWGVSDMLDRMFAGFAALPAPGPHWATVLGISEDASDEEVRTAYRICSRDRHPDVAGGSHEAMVELDEAYAQARAR